MAFVMFVARFLLLSMALCGTVNTQRIPRRPPGFTLGSGSADAGVQLESYIDLLCPDSKSAYPGLKKLVEHYAADELRVRFVLFPLPYHQHAFATAEAAFTITTVLGDKSFVTWLETIYANQDIFWNKATKDLSPVQVVGKLKTLAQKTFPSLTDKQWDEQMTGYGGTDVDDHTRESWKYTCSRGMSGTPMYTLNGVPFEADADWTFEQWYKVIDPLVKANKPVLEFQAETQAWKDVHLSGNPRALPDRDVMHLVRAGEWATTAQACEGLAGGTRACEFAPGRRCVARLKKPAFFEKGSSPKLIGIVPRKLRGCLPAAGRNGEETIGSNQTTLHSASQAAAIAAAVALTLLEADRKTVVVSYAVVEATLILINELTTLADVKYIGNNVLPKRQCNADIPAGALAAGPLIDSWIYQSDAIAKSQLAALDSFCQLPSSVLRRMRDEIPSGKLVSRCDVFHRDQTCAQFHRDYFIKGMKFAIRLYVPIYAVSLAPLVMRYLRTCCCLTMLYQVPLGFSCLSPSDRHRATVRMAGALTTLAFVAEHEHRRGSVIKAVGVYSTGAVAARIVAALGVSPKAVKLGQLVLLSAAMTVIFQRTTPDSSRMTQMLYGYSDKPASTGDDARVAKR
ncbi:Thioredoxin-like fold [Phytophthora cactorum]|nr:Thioredoxin-like fold [Phytophthora cactorum]